MGDFLLMVLAVIVGEILCRYLHGLIFSYFKADRYEDVLAKKVSKRVLNGIRNEGRDK